MSRFDALIVDFGGVLTTSLTDAMARFCEEHDIDQQALIKAALGAYMGEDDSLVTRFETGKMPEDEFATAFAERLRAESGREVEASDLVSRLFSGLRLEPDMIEAVRIAKANGLKTALLSNSWGTSLYPRDLLNEICDVIVISGEVGMRKPDPEIFTYTTDELAISPDKAVFVDDHAGHLKAAQEAGMTTVLHREPEQTISELEELLGLPLRLPR